MSFECHSPIIALTNGTPAFYLRPPTDTIQGQMYHGIGVSDWTGEIDELGGAEPWARLKPIHADPAAMKARVRHMEANVERRQQHMVERARAALGRAHNVGVSPREPGRLGRHEDKDRRV